MPSLNKPQAEFLQLAKLYRAFVGGYGSGKTRAGAAQLCRDAWELPRIVSGYFAPTYPMMRDIWYPTIDEAASDWGLRTKIVDSNKEVHLYAGQQYRSTIICRSMEKPGDIVGFKIGHAHVDEIDLLPTAKASAAWRKIIARLRHQGRGDLRARNGADVTTTPEGFRFAYQTFVKDVRDDPAKEALYGMVRASSFDNEANLPKGYIDSLLASYPRQLINAYINGRFVNLATGSVYADFDRRLNHADVQIKRGEALHVGMDFNVQKMAAIVFVTRDGAPYGVAELVNVRDTPTMCRLLQDRYQADGQDPHGIVVYPDASGQATSSKNASESDLSIIRQAGFMVRAANSNPAVRDRVNAVNGLILNAKGERRMKVNTQACPAWTEALEQQAYDAHGEPDKTTGHDHPNDAAGYRLVTDWPISRPMNGVTRLRV